MRFARWPLGGLIPLTVLAFLFCGSVLAQQVADQDAQTKAAFDAAKVTAVHGPAAVPLTDQAVLQLPATFAFVPTKEAQLILRAMGNRVGDNLLGVIFPTAPAAEGFIAVQYVKAGYIKDDDAKEWDADELLANLKAGTEEANKDRKACGIPEMEITGWVERPHYETATDQLKWSMASKDRGAAIGDPQGINYIHVRARPRRLHQQ